MVGKREITPREGRKENTRNLVPNQIEVVQNSLVVFKILEDEQKKRKNWLFLKKRR